MSLSDVTKEILKIYNTKFDRNEKEEEELEKEVKLNEEQLLKKYNDILLCRNSDKNITNKPRDKDDDFDPIKLVNESNQIETDNNKDVCNVICKMNYVEDKSFINKMIIYRIAEIKKRLMFIKYNIEIYKLIITNILNLQYKIDSGHIENNDETTGELNELNLQKKLVKEYLEKYVVKSETYIINTSICKFLFLQDRYKKLVG
uniref:Uncharacterized protein n=1 Tax=viral metagenome TaxID=1070528 RepID=A0A6C0K3J7_9ZZZZ